MRRRDVNERVERTDTDDSGNEWDDPKPAPNVPIESKSQCHDAHDDADGAIDLADVLFHAVIIARAREDDEKKAFPRFSKHGRMITAWSRRHNHAEDRSRSSGSCDICGSARVRNTGACAAERAWFGALRLSLRRSRHDVRLSGRLRARHDVGWPGLRRSRVSQRLERPESFGERRAREFPAHALVPRKFPCEAG